MHNKHKIAKHFGTDITDAAFSFARKTHEIAAEAAIDGVYVVRTSPPVTALDDTETVRSYKSFRLVERAFPCVKTLDLQVRRVYHRLADRVRAHIFLRMLAYYLEWHMQQAAGADAVRRHRQGCRRSLARQRGGAGAALSKQTTGLTEDGLPVDSFYTLMTDLASFARNTITTAITPDYPLTAATNPTPIQHKAFQLLGIAVQAVMWHYVGDIAPTIQRLVCFDDGKLGLKSPEPTASALPIIVATSVGMRSCPAVAAVVTHAGVRGQRAARTHAQAQRPRYMSLSRPGGSPA